MANTYEQKFRDVLSDMFQLDQAELDFGIYRIMNQKRADIDRFLNFRLVPEVTKTLQANATEGADISAMENEVFSHLTKFFSRYYDGGDFISKRRYKDDTYAIPYSGEEVKLYWANADQYYIKTSEYFKNYAFLLPASHRKVHFVLRDAETEQNNNKAANNMERRFALCEEDFIAEADGELNIYFTYELMPKATKQDALIKEAEAVLQPVITEHYPAYAELVTTKAPTEKNKDRSLLMKHLQDYTAKNTFDYFIHKDLGGVLRRELDFYIKNEVMFLDDLDANLILSHLAQVKAIKQVGEKIITFLAQLEDFQKKLWLKKKFVVGCDYCITLDRIPRELYPEIIRNEAQRQEWVRLFSIDEVPGYSVPLTTDFLVSNPFLVLDTKFFSADFKHRVVESMEHVDEDCNGLLINSENFQALELLQERYHDMLGGCYIDPPFNLGENADYLYKVDYKDSTWLCLIYDRILLTRTLLSKDGSLFVRCSHDGNMILRQMLNQAYGASNYRNEIILRRAEETKGDLNKQFETIKSITVNYDNLYWYSKNPSSRFNRIVKPISDQKAKAHWHSFWKAMDRPTMRYDILGIDLTKHYGQWMWEKSRAMQAVNNYKRYLEEAEPMGMSLEQFWEHNNKTMEFVKREGDKIGSIKYWIPPRIETMADSNWLDIKGYANKWGFKTENSEGAIKRIVDSITDSNDFIIDFFLGSGTTAAVALKTKRKFIGVEMGEHFNSIIIPRLSNVLHGETSGISKESLYSGGGCFKYLRLEQYEDTLNNLQVRNQQLAFKGDRADFEESYLLSYMLDTETKGDLFNLQWFVHPFDMTLKTTKDNELVETPVDMVETFNYLIGLEVETMRWPKDGYCVVEGTLHTTGERTLVIWRDCEKVSNDVLNDFFRKQAYSTTDAEFDKIYVNGDNTLPNIKKDEEHWKVVLIEEEFKKRMFEG